MRDGVYLARYQGSPVIKLTTKAFAIFIYHRHFIFDISHIISNLTGLFCSFGRMAVLQISRLAIMADILGSKVGQKI